MKITLMAAGLSGLLILLSPEASAAIVSQVLSFSPPRIITDNASGSQPNFTYRHELPRPSPGAEILGGRLLLSHAGNSNTGPTQEIWRIFGGNHLIAALGSSEKGPLTESWDLPVPVLSATFTEDPWHLELSLIEETPFNSERLDLFRSELSLEYREAPKSKEPSSIPSAPEPAGAVLFGLGSLLSGVFRKAAGAAKRD